MHPLDIALKVIWILVGLIIIIATIKEWTA